MADDRAMSEFVVPTDIRQLRAHRGGAAMPVRRRLLRSWLSQRKMALLSPRATSKRDVQEKRVNSSGNS